MAKQRRVHCDGTVTSSGNKSTAKSGRKGGKAKRNEKYILKIKVLDLSRKREGMPEILLTIHEIA